MLIKRQKIFFWPQLVTTGLSAAGLWQGAKGMKQAGEQNAAQVQQWREENKQRMEFGKTLKRAADNAEKNPAAAAAIAGAVQSVSQNAYSDTSERLIGSVVIGRR